MRVVIQRVSRAAVTVDAETVASIGRGLVALVGVVWLLWLRATTCACASMRATIFGVRPYCGGHRGEDGPEFGSGLALKIREKERSRQIRDSNRQTL